MLVRYMFIERVIKNGVSRKTWWQTSEKHFVKRKIYEIVKMKMFSGIVIFVPYRPSLLF